MSGPLSIWSMLAKGYSLSPCRYLMEAASARRRTHANMCADNIMGQVAKVLNGIKQAKSPSAAKNLLAHLQSYQARLLQPSMHVRIMAVLNRCGHHYDVVKWFDSAQRQGRQMNLAGYTCAIQATQRLPDSAGALQLLEKMQSDGIRADVVVYNAVLAACDKDGQWQTVLQLMQNMKDEGIAADVITYNTAISACGKGGQLKRALGLLNEGHAEGVAPDTITYSTVITACGRAGEWQAALQVMEDMRADGVRPTTITFSAATSACAKGGQWQRALRLMEDMESEGIRANTITYSSTINACAKAGKWRVAERLLKEMQVKGVHANTVTYSAAISACEKDGHWRQALKLIVKMQSLGIGPNIVTYSSAIGVCMKARKWHQVLNLVGEMKSKGIPLNDFTQSAAFSAGCRTNRWEEVLQMVPQMGATVSDDSNPPPEPSMPAGNGHTQRRGRGLQGAHPPQAAVPAATGSSASRAQVNADQMCQAIQSLEAMHLDITLDKMFAVYASMSLVAGAPARAVPDGAAVQSVDSMTMPPPYSGGPGVGARLTLTPPGQSQGTNAKAVHAPHRWPIHHGASPYPPSSMTTMLALDEEYILFPIPPPPGSRPNNGV